MSEGVRWDPVLRVLDGAERVLAVAHANPDADALGSALAFANAWRDRGGSAQVTFPGAGSALPEDVEWLPGAELVVSSEQALRERYDAVITFDASDADRIGEMISVVRPPGALIAIDHHASFRSFADVEVVETVPATGLLCLELLDAMGSALTKPVATCLYAAIASDTGSFRYPGTDADTLRAAARLMEAGANAEAIGLLLFDTRSEDYLRLLGEVLADLRIDPDDAGGRGLVWIEVGAEQRQRRGIPLVAIESFVNVIRTVSSADVAVVLKQDDTGLWRVSSRSRGATDVGSACAALGGGGHRFAGGFTGGKDAQRTLAAFREAL